MKQFLIIPLGGLGTRFTNAGYKTYKPFLRTSSHSRIIDNIVANFPSSKTHLILICNKKKYNYIKKNYKRKNTTFIKIKNHKFGPLHSIDLARKELKKIIQKNKFFISYSDINWKWDFKSPDEIIRNKKIVVFSHAGFHPHLEINPHSDFFLCNKKNNIVKVSKKKSITDNYRNNHLAIGCYYFQDFQYFEKFFDNRLNKKNYKKKNETYIIDFLEFCLKNKIEINHYKVKKFVHLGDPYQYENFIQWKNTLTNDFKKSINLKYDSVMLMAGEGKRVKTLKEKKPFLKIKNFKAYDYIFEKFGLKKKIIITNDNYFNSLDAKYLKFKINRTKSMLQTFEKSFDYIKDLKNFFILSCDCFGIFDQKNFKSLLKKNDPDIVLFAFDISKIQKKMTNSHTTIDLKKNNIKSIQVKKYTTRVHELGHAGFFWVKNTDIFKNLKKFHLSNKIKREILLDDYFKFLFDKKLCKVSCFKLNEYIHFGSVTEYLELKYWINFFNHEN